MGWVKVMKPVWVRAEIVRSVKSILRGDAATGEVEAVLLEDAPPAAVTGERLRFGCGDWTTREEKPGER